MACVLVIDDDPGTRETLSILLRANEIDVLTAESGGDALACLQRKRIDLIVSDLRLPDSSGIEILRHLRQHSNSVPFVLVTGFGTIRSAVEAMRLGAADYLEKPFDEDEVLTVIQQSLSPSASGYALLPPDAPAITRWVRIVMSIVEARTDPKNLQSWAALALTSRSTLENWCRAAGLQARASLKFGRLLRATLHADELGWRPEDLLDLDPRTLQRLASEYVVARALFSGDSGTHATQFLRSQRIITQPLALELIERELRRRRDHR